MQTRKNMLTMLLGLCAISCGADKAAPWQVGGDDAAALMLPFPDEYFGMFVARDAAARATPPEGCAALMEDYAQAWENIQPTAQFKQLTDTGPWKASASLRDSYAGSGCFTSGPTLSQPSADCKAEFGKLVEAWHEVERTPQFNVLIASPANHDVYASWVNAVALKCYLDS